MSGDDALDVEFDDVLDVALDEAEACLRRAGRDDLVASLSALGPLLVARELRAQRERVAPAPEAAPVDVGALALALGPQDRLALAEALVASLGGYETEIEFRLAPAVVAILLARGGTPRVNAGIVFVRATSAAGIHDVTAYATPDELDAETRAKVAHLFPEAKP